MSKHKEQYVVKELLENLKEKEKLELKKANMKRIYLKIWNKKRIEINKIMKQTENAQTNKMWKQKEKEKGRLEKKENETLFGITIFEGKKGKQY